MRILALIEAPGHVCSRYRIEPFRGSVEAAGGSLTIEALERSLPRRVAQLARAGRFDCVILQRKLLPLWQLEILRRSARRLLFDFDDAVVYRDSNDRRGPHCPRRASRFRSLMRRVDGVLAGNHFLAELAEKAGAASSRIHYFPTTIRLDRYPTGIEKSENPGLTMVWIGSSSTLSGLERLDGVWRTLGSAISPPCRLKVICDRFPDFRPLEVLPVPWAEATEVEELTRSDVGISWIPDDLWSRGKCGLKVLQYMAAGLPVLANPVGVHPEMIRPGETGELVNSPEEWVEAVRSLTDDPQRRSAFGRNARRAVETGYSAAAWGPTFVSVVEGRTPLAGPHRAINRPAVSKP